MAVAPAHPPLTPDTVVLRDGTIAEIRLLRFDDRPAVTALFRSCSVENLYTRFFTVGLGVVTQHIDHLFDTDTGTLTYVLFKDGQLLGIADVEPCGDSTSEIAFLVSDDAHSLGIATLLLERAAHDAQIIGVDWFVADVLAINRQMLQVFADAGYSVERHNDHGEVSVRMSTSPDAVTRAAITARHVAVTSALGPDSAGASSTPH